MTNRESLVDYPSPYYTVRQFSKGGHFDHAVKGSYDWFAGGIFGGFFMRKKKDGRRNLLCLTQKDLVL